MPYLDASVADRREVFSLGDQSMSVGRSQESDIALEGDRGVSRLHARLEGWCITDLGSRNGTFVNGSRITAPTALRPGDEVRIGGWRLVFTAQSADEEWTLVDDETGASAAPQPQAPPPVVDLSPREREVLALLAGGATDEEIGARLFISTTTVRSHLDRIRDKTGCRRRPELTRLAVEQGIVPAVRSDRAATDAPG
jgi:DNA-binding CsgD family transcriptional regulator